MNIKDEEIKWVLMRHVRTKEEKGKMRRHVFMLESEQRERENIVLNFKKCDM